MQSELKEKNWIKEQNYKNLHVLKNDLIEQLKIAKNSEAVLRKSLEKLQKDFNEKENFLKSFDEKFKLAEESLRLFYEAIRNKEHQINQEKV